MVGPQEGSERDFGLAFREAVFTSSISFPAHRPRGLRPDHLLGSFIVSTRRPGVPLAVGLLVAMTLYYLMNGTTRWATASSRTSRGAATSTPALAPSRGHSSAGYGVGFGGRVRPGGGHRSPTAGGSGGLGRARVVVGIIAVLAYSAAVVLCRRYRPLAGRPGRAPRFPHHRRCRCGRRRAAERVGRHPRLHRPLLALRPGMPLVVVGLVLGCSPSSRPPGSSAGNERR